MAEGQASERAARSMGLGCDQMNYDPLTSILGLSTDLLRWHV
jgi:hypothetical protein